MPWQLPIPAYIRMWSTGLSLRDLKVIYGQNHDTAEAPQDMIDIIKQEIKSVKWAFKTQYGSVKGNAQTKACGYRQ